MYIRAGLVVALTLAQSADSAPITTPALMSVLAGFHTAQRDRVRDEFAQAAPRNDIIGRSFRIRWKVGSGDQLGGYATSGFYTYKLGRITFQVSTDQFGYDPANRIRTVEGFVFGVSRTPAGTYIGNNAFGASVRVQRFSVSKSGIAALSTPVGEFSPGREAPTELPEGAVENAKSTYWVQIEASPDEARRLSQSVVVQIEGKISPLPIGEAVDCDRDHVAATVANPEETSFSNCWAGGTVQAISFIDERSGVTLRKWETQRKYSKEWWRR